MSVASSRSTTAGLAKGKPYEGQWLERRWCLRFTLAGLFLGAVNFRCMTLLRPLDQPPYPVTPSLFDLLPAAFAPSTSPRGLSQQSYPGFPASAAGKLATISD